MTNPQKNDPDNLSLVLAGLQGGDIVANEDSALVGSAAREKVEVESALLVAMNRPRDEQKAYASLMKAVQRPGMAGAAEYVFPRGSASVHGPTVTLAREAARLWGNMRYGVRVIAMDDEEVHVLGFAWDLQTNQHVSAEARFRPLVQRKGGWVKADERNLRELINRHGALCIRNAILQLIPKDVIDDACKTANQTLQKMSAGELEEDRESVIRATVRAFMGLGVTVEMLDEYLEHPVANLTAEERAELRGIFTSLSEGHSKIQDYFNLNAGRGVKRGNGDSNKGRISIGDLKKKEEPAADADPEPQAEHDAIDPDLAKAWGDMAMGDQEGSHDSSE